MEIRSKRVTPAQRFHADLLEHFKNCLRCRSNGGQDAGRKSLCPSGQALYGLWDRQLVRAEKMVRGEVCE